MPISAGSDSTNSLNAEMRTFANQMLSLPSSNPSKFDDWYHRQSGCIVLAVCQWRKAKEKLESDGDANGDEFIYTHGINIEVSLPTGSICAERAAITQAHTNFPALQGKGNLVAVAVFEHSQQGRNPMRPCEVCQMWLKKLAAPEFRVLAYPNQDFEQYIEFYCPWSI